MSARRPVLVGMAPTVWVVVGSVGRSFCVEEVCRRNGLQGACRGRRGRFHQEAGCRAEGADDSRRAGGLSVGYRSRPQDH